MLGSTCACTDDIIAAASMNPNSEDLAKNAPRTRMNIPKPKDAFKLAAWRYSTYARKESRRVAILQHRSQRMARPSEDRPIRYRAVFHRSVAAIAADHNPSVG